MIHLLITSKVAELVADKNEGMHIQSCSCNGTFK